MEAVHETCPCLEDKHSPLLEKLYLSKPNTGYSELGEVIEAENFQSLAQIFKRHRDKSPVVGPEDPLINGIVDEFKKFGKPAIGADKNGLCWKVFKILCPGVYGKK